MKKKFISFLSVSLGILIFTSLASACKVDRPLHIWAESWSFNATTHWHACTDEGCPGKDAYDYHDFELVSTEVEPTCSKTGKGHYKCNVCGYEKDDAIPTTPHDYKLQSTLLEANCINPGRGTYKCSVCGHTEDMQIPATGKHSFGDTYAKDANSHWHECLIEGCNAKDQVSRHTKGQKVIMAPEGWEDGTSQIPCGQCGYILSVDVISNPKAPAKYDLAFFNEMSGKSVRPVQTEENGKIIYTAEFKKDVSYRILLVNAYNGDGDQIDLEMNTLWNLDEPQNLHGIKVYSIEDRSGREEYMEHFTHYSNGFTITPELDGVAKPYEVYISASKLGEYNLIFRYETGVESANNRKIRVEHFLRITVVEA